MGMSGRLKRAVARRLRWAASALDGGAAAPQPSGAPAPAPVLAIGTSVSVTQEDILRFCHHFRSFEVEGVKKVRLGNAHDGGYIFLDDFAAISAVISCGISNDVTCDEDLANMGKKILQYDHTVPGPPVQHSNFVFHKQAIDERLVIPGSTKLSDVVRYNGDSTKCDLLLKIDIDGGEWECFADFPPQHFARLRQIACEFHWSSRLTDPAIFRECEMAIANITRHFFPVHFHANNYVGFANVMGVPLPEVFEVTFVNKALFKPGRPYISGPEAIDTPNNPDAPDLFLGAPFFQQS